MKKNGMLSIAALLSEPCRHPEKQVQVFISSTFRDMQVERDHLVRFVFPRLREQSLLRRIRLVDVDRPSCGFWIADRQNAEWN